MAPPAAEEGGGDALAAFAGDGLRWAFRQLSLRAQVAGVMEEMLATVEVRALSCVVVGWVGVWLVILLFSLVRLLRGSSASIKA